MKKNNNFPPNVIYIGGCVGSVYKVKREKNPWIFPAPCVPWNLCDVVVVAEVRSGGFSHCKLDLLDGPVDMLANIPSFFYQPAKPNVIQCQLVVILVLKVGIESCVL